MAFMMSNDKPEKNVWAAASKVIKTRKPDQCSKRWKDALDPNIKHTPWTADEDATLAEAYGVYGTSWSEIRANCFPCRSNLELKNRCVEDASDAEDGHANPLHSSFDHLSRLSRRRERAQGFDTTVPAASSPSTSGSPPQTNSTNGSSSCAASSPVSTAGTSIVDAAAALSRSPILAVGQDGLMTLMQKLAQSAMLQQSFPDDVPLAYSHMPSSPCLPSPPLTFDSSVSESEFTSASDLNLFDFDLDMDMPSKVDTAAVVTDDMALPPSMATEGLFDSGVPSSIDMDSTFWQDIKRAFSLQTHSNSASPCPAAASYVPALTPATLACFGPESATVDCGSTAETSQEKEGAEVVAASSPAQDTSMDAVPEEASSAVVVDAPICPEKGVVAPQDGEPGAIDCLQASLPDDRVIIVMCNRTSSGDVLRSLREALGK